MRNRLAMWCVGALVLCLSPFAGLAFDVVSHEWAFNFGGEREEQGQCVFVDPDRNVFVSGYFQSTVDFDSGPGVSELSSPVGADAFVLKLDSDGKFLWVKGIGGTGDAIAYEVLTDADGNLLILGYLTGTCDFDPGPGVAELKAKGSADVFILKLNKLGNFVWVKHLRPKEANSSVYGQGFALDGNGNVYISGILYGTVDFDPSADKLNLTSVGGSDAYVMKLNDDGDLIWVKQLGSAAQESGSAAVVDLNGSLYVCGAFTDTLDLDPGPDIDVVTTAGMYDTFLLKLDLNGNHVWAHTFGGTGDDYPYALTLDNVGDVFMAGSYADTVQFGLTSLTSEGEQDVFLMKVSQVEGTGVHWATSIGGTGFDRPFALCADESGNAYVGGVFSATANFGVGIDQIQLTSGGEGDTFQAKYEPNGSFTWAAGMGDEGHDVCLGLDVDDVGNIYSTGSFEGSVIFDPNPSFLPALVSDGETDIFVCKLNFIPNGSVKVKLKPKGARQNGAAWRIDNTPPWRKHNAQVNDVSIGQHTIQFKPVPGKKTPSSRAISIEANEIETLTGKYQPARK